VSAADLTTQGHRAVADLVLARLRSDGVVPTDNPTPLVMAKTSSQPQGNALQGAAPDTTPLQDRHIVYPTGKVDEEGMVRSTLDDDELLEPVGPVIGVLTQDAADLQLPGQVFPVNWSYLSASYVKWVEMGGSRVVPLLYTDPPEVLTEKFGYLNGLLFPGGNADIYNFTSPYMQSAALLYDLAVAANQKGEHFPVFGICMGHELLAVLSQRSTAMLYGTKQLDAKNMALKLDFTPAAQSSRFFSQATPELMDKLSTEAISHTNNGNGIKPGVMATDPKLSDFFSVLGVSKDRRGQEYVTALEAKHFPFFSLQGHPEKLCFEWSNRKVIPHTTAAVSACHYFSDFFASESRKNGRTYPPEKLRDDVIYNFVPQFANKIDSRMTIMQVYWFPGDVEVRKTQMARVLRQPILE
jgi:gamma-glutamyl hydrolase